MQALSYNIFFYPDSWYKKCFNIFKAFSSKVNLAGKNYFVLIRNLKYTLL
jgi:hypothetical protein